MSEQKAIQAVLWTFDIPRKSYLHSLEWIAIGNLWRRGWLSAGEVTTDEIGKAQVFSLTEEGRELAMQVIN